MTKDQVLKLAEFDYDKKYWEQFHDSSQEDVRNGAQQENARLLPLITALAERQEKLLYEANAMYSELGRVRDRCQVKGGVEKVMMHFEKALAEDQARMEKLK